METIRRRKSRLPLRYSLREFHDLDPINLQLLAEMAHEQIPFSSADRRTPVRSILVSMLTSGRFNADDFRAFALAISWNNSCYIFQVENLEELSKKRREKADTESEAEKRIHFFATLVRQFEKNRKCDLKILSKAMLTQYYRNKISEDTLNSYLEALVFLLMGFDAPNDLIAEALNAVPLIKTALKEQKDQEKLFMLLEIRRPEEIFHFENYRFANESIKKAHR